MENSDVLIQYESTGVEKVQNAPDIIKKVERDTIALIVETKTVVDEFIEIAQKQLAEPEDQYTEEVKTLIRNGVNLSENTLKAITEPENENKPLSNVEKRELLKSDMLAQLSIPEYIQVWKRLNPYFLSHITRQGFRDHNKMMEHSSGLREYSNGFSSVMHDDALIRPRLALEKLKSRDE